MKFAQQLFRLFAARPAQRVPTVAPAPLMLALEPRIVYEASLGVVPVAHHVGASHHHVDHAFGAKPSTVPGEGAVPGTVAGSGAGGNRESELNHKTQLAVTAREGVQPEKQVVFIDPNVTDYQELIAGLTPGTRYVVLNPNTDGLEQIAQYLQKHPDVGAIDLISHGSDGQIQIGSTLLTASDLAQYSAELAQIGAAMKPGGDFLIYGCDVAEYADGQALVQQIAARTGLNVAASTTPIGAASLGGDWTLNYETGTIDAPAALSAAAEQHYGYLLAETVEEFNNADDSGFDSGTTTSFTLDGITYTYNEAIDTIVAADPSLQQLSDESSADQSLQINQNGATGLTSVTISMEGGKTFTMSSLDIDVDADNDVEIQANGSATGEITLVSDADFVTQTVSFTGNSAFDNVNNIVITFADPIVNIGHLVFTENSPPVVTTTGGTTDHEVGAGATVIDSGVTLSDSEATTQESATVSIGSGFHSGDTLSFSNTSATTYGNITVQSYDTATGVLTLNSSGSTATNAQWQAALDAITFSTTSTTTGNRTISFTTNDGSFSSAAATDTVDVTAAPVVTTSGGATSYEAGATATSVDSGVTLTDGSHGTEASATVTISSGDASGDTLSFTNSSATLYGNISGSFSGDTLTLTSSGESATTAQWTHALEAIEFSTTSGTTGDRTISFSINDGTVTSDVATKTVDVTVGPVVTTSGGVTSHEAGASATDVDGSVTLTDGSHGTEASATVTITSGDASGDVLSFSNTSSTLYGNISASFSGDVLTLASSGTSATTAQWTNALEAVAFSTTSTTTGDRTLSFAVNDGSVTSSVATKTVDVTAGPVVTTSGGTTAYASGGSATSVDSGVTLTDGSTSSEASATATISSGDASGDTLSFSNSSSTLYGNISGVFSGGVLTLTSSGATATTAQWTNALEAVAFSTTSTTTGDRTISFVVNDGSVSSAVATKTVDVTNPLAVTTDSGSASFVAGDNTTATPVAVDPGLTVTDTNTSFMTSATVAITGNFHSGEDVLAFTNNGSTMGNITGSYDAAAGVFTLSSAGSSATLAQWQTALDAVTYTDTAVTPNNSTRTISFTVTDANGITSDPATRTVTVTDVDQTPILTTTGGTTNYVGGTSATAIDGGVTVSDLDNTTQASGTVSITTGFHSGDTLSFTNSSSALFGNIVASYNAATGVLTLNSPGATSSDAQWANAFDAVSFSAASSATPGNRTISFTVNDGTENSAAATDTVDVLGPPTVTTDSGSASFTAGDNVASTPVTIDSGLTVTDGGASTLASATVAITGNFHSGEDVLAFTNNGSTMGNITGSYDAATGVFTLSSAGSSATLAQWQTALDAVTYTDTAVTPNHATRTISFTVTDVNSDTSNTATRTVTVVDVDQTPILTTTGGTTNYVGGTGATAIDGGVTVSDLDNTTQASGTVSITTGFHSGDTLSFTNTSSTLFGNIVASYNAATGVLTLNSAGATSSDAQWANAFDAVSFSAASSATPGNRTISFTVSDGTENSATATDTVDVLGPPTVTTDSGSASFTAGDNVASTPVTVDSGLTVTDGGASTLASATVAITGNFHAGEDQLAFTNNGTSVGNITGSYNTATGVLTLNSAGSTATLAQWQAALDAVTYTDTAVTPNTATRTISFTVTDANSDTSNTATRTVTVADVDQTPVVTTTTGATRFVSGDNATPAPVTVDSGITVSDRDNATLASATVSITSGLQRDSDELIFNANSATMGNITGSYSASTGVLSLSSSGASATLAQWQAALDSIQYNSTAAAPNAGARSVTFTVSDGIKTSQPVSTTVDVVVVVASTPPATVTSTDLPAAVSHPPGDATEFNGPPPPGERPGDSVSNPLIVLDALDQAPAIGATPAPLTITFTDPNAQYSHLPVDHTSVTAVSPDAMFEPSAADSSMFESIPVVVDFNPAPDRPFSLNLSNVVPTVDGLVLNAASDVSVQLADGRSLPAWLHYDAATGTLSGVMPAATHDVRIAVQQRDAAGHVTRSEIMLAPGGQHAHHAHARPAPHAARHALTHAVERTTAQAPLPAGKPSLAQQFAQARAALHVVRPAANTTVTAAAPEQRA
jgi:hypothetical protein